MNIEKSLDISWKAILKIGIAFFGFYILYLIRNILIWLIFALIISILFNPAIEFLRRLKVPRFLAVSFVYISFFCLLILIIYLTTSFFIAEIKQLSQSLPQYFKKISPFLMGLEIEIFKNTETFINILGDVFNKIMTNIANILFLIFGGIFATIFVLVLALYLSLEEKGIERALVLFFPKKYEDYVVFLWERCQKKVSGWFFSRIIACLFIGIISLITFLLFDIPYPFIFGLIAGILNFIPIIGPIITGILLFLIISLENIIKAIFIIVVFTLIQQIENNILTPFLSRKFVGLPPALVLISLAIGSILWGFLGAILAIPLTGIIFEFSSDFLRKKRESEEMLSVENSVIRQENII